MKKVCPIKRYVVDLSEEERARCEKIVSQGKTSAGMVTRARILLMADVSNAGLGWTDEKIAEALGAATSTVGRVRMQLVEEGFDAVFTRKKPVNPSYKKTFDGASEARLIALACSEAPEGHARWTIRLLYYGITVTLYSNPFLRDRSGPRFLGRGSRPVWAARKAGELGAADGFAGAQRRDRVRRRRFVDQVGKSSAAAVQQRPHPDKPILAAGKMSARARPAPVLGASP
jgi:hypothetical protein